MSINTNEYMSPQNSQIKLATKLSTKLDCIKYSSVCFD